MDDETPLNAADGDSVAAGWPRTLAALLLVATVLFNPLLAIVNGHVHHIGGSVVAGTQALIVFAAFGIGATARPVPARWLLLAWGLGLTFLAICLIRGDFQIKNLGDSLLIPAFVCLGTRLDDRLFVRLMTGIQAAVVIVGIWELLDPKGFGTVFKVLDYYVATRGYDPKLFYAGGDLFVSSERGGGRFMLAFTHWHRGSSLFLEPVSLGNWACVMALFTATYWERFDWRWRIGFLASIAIVLITCDGRLGLGVCLVLALWLPFARLIPGRFAALDLPVFIAMLAVLKGIGYLPQTGDTLTGRMRGGFDLLFDLDLSQLFGLGALSRAAVDAGWVYLVETQSVLVALAFWLFVTLSDTGEDSSSRIMKHGVALFVVLCMPISYAVFSVKTSGCLWAMYGLFFQKTMRAHAERLRAKKRDAHGLRVVSPELVPTL